MSDDYTRALSELQGAHAEVMTCYVCGRRTDEAREQFDRVMARAREVCNTMRTRCDHLSDSIDRAEATVSATESAPGD